jgi:hypothetical protein
MKMEEICIRKIEGGIRGIKLGTKTPMDVDITNSFNRLKEINQGMYADLMNNYKKVLEEYKKRTG